MMQLPPDSNSDARDDWESHWSDYSESARVNPAQHLRRQLILDALCLSPKDRVLDIGSGTGDLAAAVAAAAPWVDIVGLELSRRGVEIARAKVPAASFRQVNLLNGVHSDEQLGWANKVVCSEVLEHVESPVELLKSGLRHAETGALVIVTVPAGPRTAFDKHIGHRRHYDRASLEAVLEEAGVSTKLVRSVGFPFFNLYRLIVFARGKRLIDDVASGSVAASGESGITHLLYSVFDTLFKVNCGGSRWGWQLIGVGHKR